jgi:hypothetical protein
MIEICPAGPPKLMKPSLSQKRKASRRLIGSGRRCSGSGETLKPVLLVPMRIEPMTVAILERFE